MENKLSKGGSLRIKSPQLYHPATPVTTGTSGTALHTGAGDRSENGSAGRAVQRREAPDRAGAICVFCGHEFSEHFRAFGRSLCDGADGCRCRAFKARGGAEAGKAVRS